MINENNFLGDIEIPANTCVVIHQDYILNHPKLWSDPEQFRPERFIEDGFSQKAFIPFSTGLRRCVGEGFALKNLFFSVVRLMQATYDVVILLESDHDLEPQHNTQAQFLYPKNFSIKFG